MAPTLALRWAHYRMPMALVVVFALMWLLGSKPPAAPAPADPPAGASGRNSKDGDDGEEEEEEEGGLDKQGEIAPASDVAFSLAWRQLVPRIRQGEALGPLPGLVARARGLVLELGPGTGSQLGRYDRSRVRCVYGVEPNALLARDLAQTCRRAGWRVRFQNLARVDAVESGPGRRHAAAAAVAESNPKKDDASGAAAGMPEYVICNAGIDEWLASPAAAGVRGRIDTVLSVQVLCSVPDAAQTCRTLYEQALAPGGQFLMYEHVRAGDSIARAVQSFYTAIGWTFLVGGCHLDRDIKRCLLDAGAWDTVELDYEGEDWWLMNRVYGCIVKPGKKSV